MEGRAGVSCQSLAMALQSSFANPLTPQWKLPNKLSGQCQLEYPQVSMVCHAQTRFHHWLLRNIATAWVEQEPQASIASSMLPNFHRQQDIVPEESKMPPLRRGPGEAPSLKTQHISLFPQKTNLGRRHNCNSSTVSGDADGQPQHCCPDCWQANSQGPESHQSGQIRSHSTPSLPLSRSAEPQDSSEDC